MIVSCTNCKKRYKIDPEKLKKIKSSFKCRQCGHPIHVRKPVKAQNQVTQPLYAINDKNYQKRLRSVVLRQISSTQSLSSSPKKYFFTSKLNLKLEHFSRLISGLWGKMVILFFLVPIFILFASSMLSFSQLRELTLITKKDSSALASMLAQDKISEFCRAVASQAGIYLKAHPKLRSDQFIHTPAFKRIAIQEVDSADSTVLYQMPDRSGTLRVWAHRDPKLVGRDLREINKASFTNADKENFSKFLNILMGVGGLKESSGFFNVMVPSGELKQKYMVCTPIEGTPYVIAAASFIDEFAQPVKQFEMLLERKIENIRWIVLLGLLTTMLTTGTVVFVYGNRLTRSLTALIHAANRISVGDLNVKVVRDREDELGELAQAIIRLQESIRLFLRRTGQQTKS